MHVADSKPQPRRSRESIDFDTPDYFPKIASARHVWRALGGCSETHKPEVQQVHKLQQYQRRGFKLV
jgi:hypothetical protein